MLRPISQADYPALFEWRADLLELHIWGSSRKVPTWEEFLVEMSQLLSGSVTLLVLAREREQPIGFVQAFNHNPSDGWCFTVAYIRPEYRGRPHAAEAYIALLEYLFRSFPVRKVYADVSEFNIHPMKPLMAGGFVEEGRFREHTWHDDRYWDVIRLAMHREKWNEVRDRARFLLGVQEQAGEMLEAEQARRDGATTHPPTQ